MADRQLSSADWLEVLVTYGECGRNLEATAASFNERFPELPALNRQRVTRLLARVRATGSVQPARRRRRAAPARDERHQQQVLGAVAENPHTSYRVVAREVGICHRTVLRILHAHKFHPYHMQIHQHLQIRDPPRRLEFCGWIDGELDVHPNFTRNILWSDEATFTRDGNVNTHNAHYWSVENPHWLREGGYQERWKVNVWCGIHNNRVVGPFFLPAYNNGRVYCDLLRGEVEDFLDDLPVAVERAVWFQHDGAPAHFDRLVRQYLNRRFPNQWIGRGGPVSWPPRSPDLNPLDYFLWGFLKEHVYRTAPTNVQDLRERITAACALVTPDMLHAVRNNFGRRVRMCIGMEGGHVEHFLT